VAVRLRQLRLRPADEPRGRMRENGKKHPGVLECHTRRRADDCYILKGPSPIASSCGKKHTTLVCCHREPVHGEKHFNLKVTTGHMEGLQPEIKVYRP